MPKRASKNDVMFDEFPGFSVQEEWDIVSAFIDNLAEYKIVEYIFRHCWDISTEIKLEEFMHGYFNEDGSKTNYGTGLSKPSVIAGIKKALQHGLIECEVDESDKTHIRKYYRIHMNQTAVNDFYPVDEETDPDMNVFYVEEDDVKNVTVEEMPLAPDFTRGKEVLPPSEENSNYLHSNITCNNISRIQQLDNLPERVISNKPRGKSKYPGFIRSYMESFSSDLGDLEHTASNIAQATNIYLTYIANGGNTKAFVDLMIQAKETTQKKPGIRCKNSSNKRNAMPYFFACLKRAVQQPSRESIAV